MRERFFLAVFVTVFLGTFTGCNALVGGAVGGAVAADELKRLDEKKEEGLVFEVDPDATVTKLQLCENGMFIFSNEWCGVRVPVDLDLQDSVRRRFPASEYVITKIERTREKPGYDVFYVHLKRVVQN